LLVLIGGLGLTQRPLRSTGGATAQEETGLPPTLALITIALGPVRGLIADMLWWRAIDLQEEGEFFEVAQLSGWITAMQPRNTHVWAFQAWNMSYNLAAEFPDRRERWPWVERALDLLRGDALRVNPGHPHLHGELIRIFQDRIAKVTNAEWEIFIRQWVLTMQQAFVRGDGAELAELAGMPADPERLRTEPEVAGLLAAAGPDHSYLLSSRNWQRRGSWPPELERLRRAPEHAAAWAYLDRWHRANLLRTRHRLDLDHALQVERQYGPLDWRLPQAQAVYWGSLDPPSALIIGGLDYGQLARQSLENAVFYGRLIEDKEADTLVFAPNLALIGRVADAYDRAVASSLAPERDRVLHHEFLKRAIALLYSCGREQEARRLHTWLCRVRGDQTEEFSDFIAENLFRLINFHFPQSPAAAINDALDQSCNWLAAGDPGRARGYDRFAELLWRRATAVQPLPPLAELREAAVARLSAASLPPSYQRRLAAGMAGITEDQAAPEPEIYLGREVQ